MCAPFSVSVASRASDDFAVFEVHIRIAFGNDTGAPRALEVSPNHLTSPRFRVSRPHRQATAASPF